MNLLSWTPRITANGLRIGNPDRARGSDMADVGRLDMKVKLLPLLHGALIVPMLDIEHASVLLVRDVQDCANWNFAFTDDTESGPLKVPAIRRLTINDSQLR